LYDSSEDSGELTSSEFDASKESELYDECEDSGEMTSSEFDDSKE
jgi:hypothetical protein